ncbi:MAG: putative unusual protein kinase [uncultured archaeon A07HR60]|nr:MAG: putative unusual protein kinase [uncultured archaeon A07HR60]
MVTLVNFRAYRRFFTVFRQFSPLIFAWWRDRRRFFVFGGTRSVSEAISRGRAEILLNTLLTLGPTFIKLGQLLSTRPDILPPVYVEVFSKLQDDVPPAPWDESQAVLESDLGDVDEVFDNFDREPISGASLGQVYTAEHEGQQVAVKVRRPDIRQLVEADLRVVRWSLPLVRRFIGGGRAFSLDNLADEFDKTIHEEMDYNREREMLGKIGNNFADNDKMVIPDAVPELSSQRVLTMEFISGTKIDNTEQLDANGLDRTDIAQTLQRVYLQMIVVDGTFHADPHPGNLAIDDQGRIIFYDFGMSSRVDPFIQDRIVDFYIAVASQNIDAILDTLIEMGTLSPEADRDVMGQVLELAIADARGQDIEQYRVEQILGQVESSIYEFPLRLPRNLALVLRVAGVVEGVCVTLDPEFDFVDTATDYLGEQGYGEETAREVVSASGDQLQRAASSLFKLPPKLETVLNRADRGDLEVQVVLDDDQDVIDRLGKRIAYSLLVAVGILSSSILFAFADAVNLAIAALVVTAPLVIALYRSFRKKRGIRAKPQFTRQNLDDRRRD